MEDITKLEIPPATTPSSEHGQLLYALGSMTAEMRSLKEYQAKANGFMAKIDERVKVLELAKQNEDGKEQGISAIWAVVYSIGSLIVGGVITFYATRGHL